MLNIFLQVFDILPLYGILQPGDTEQVTMTFYGHADIWGQAKAICEVEGGPTYELMLKGEASLVSYKFDCKEIHYGKQVRKKYAFRKSKLFITLRPVLPVLLGVTYLDSGTV